MSLRQSSIAGDGMSDLHVLQDMIARELATQYDLIIFRNMTPLRFGYPMHRPRMGEFAMVTVLTFVFFFPLVRFYVIGILRPNSMDLGSATRTSSASIEHISHRLPTPQSFWNFLKLQLNQSIPWARFNQLPNADELDGKLRRCQCRLDPSITCPLHKCSCTQCKHKPGGQCSWRALHSEFLVKKYNHGLPGIGDRISYIEMLEMAGVPTPKSARERSMLNIMALLEQAPLHMSNMILDSSQSLGRAGERTDGQVMTLATNTKAWSIRKGGILSPSEVISLSGLPKSASFDKQSESSVYSMIGNCMHTSDIGTSAGLALFMKMAVLPPL